MFMLQFLLNRNSESELSLERQNELLGKTNKELDHFVYSVSHDLRAPLSSILGLTTIYNLATSEQEKASIVNMIRDRARTLDSFISEVLDYSRNTRVELKLQKVMLLELIDELLEGILHMNGAKEVAIDIQVASDLSIATDRERIKVVLSNILSNAIYYRDPSKKSTLVIETEIQDGSMLIRIRDNGIGIKKEHLHRIFEMFYKAHDRAHGSGLGLYIVRETLHRLQGEITVDSTYAVSSTFTIRLPITPSVLAEGSAPVLVDSQAHS
jgi:signal transduction histidine kinase